MRCLTILENTNFKFVSVSILLKMSEVGLFFVSIWGGGARIGDTTGCLLTDRTLGTGVGYFIPIAEYRRCSSAVLTVLTSLRLRSNIVCTCYQVMCKLFFS
jgi:hypothetical protein